MGMWDSGIGGELTGGRSAKNALKRGIAAQKKATEEAKKLISESTRKAEGIAQAGYGAAGDYLNKGFGQGIDSVNQGYGQGFDYMNQAQGRLDPLAGMFDPSMGNQFSIGGIADNLSQFSDPNGPFGQLIADRMASSGEAAAGAGLARSGNRMAEAGRIPMQEALGLNSMLFSQQLQNPALAAIQAQSGIDQSMGGMAINQGNALAGLQTGQGGALAALEQSKLQDLSNMALGEGSNLANLNVGLGAAEAANANAQASAGLNAASTGIGIAGDIAKVVAMSDVQLKENIVKTGEHNGLNTYSWTWNSKANELGLDGDSQGHIAQEVQQIHPELVEMSSVGYLTINYGTDKTVAI